MCWLLFGEEIDQIITAYYNIIYIETQQLSKSVKTSQSENIRTKYIPDIEDLMKSDLKQTYPVSVRQFMIVTAKFEQCFISFDCPYN